MVKLKGIHITRGKIQRARAVLDTAGYLTFHFPAGEHLVCLLYCEETKEVFALYRNTADRSMPSYGLFVAKTTGQNAREQNMGYEENKGPNEFTLWFYRWDKKYKITIPRCHPSLERPPTLEVGGATHELQVLW